MPYTHSLNTNRWFTIVLGCATLAACGGGTGSAESTSKTLEVPVADLSASAAASEAVASAMGASAAALAASQPAETKSHAAIASLSMPTVANSDNTKASAPNTANQQVAIAGEIKPQAQEITTSASQRQEAPYVVDDDAQALSRSTIQSGTEQTSSAVSSGPMITINSTDKIAELTSSAPLASQTWSGINCYAVFGSYSKYGENGIHGAPLPDKSTMRFGKIADPTNKNRNVVVFRVNKDDVLTAGGKRCESVAPPTAQTGVPVNQVFWYAFSIRMPEGNRAADNIILSQWHTLGFNPPWALYLKNGKLSATVRFNNNTIATQSNTKIGGTWTDSQLMGSNWQTFVVQAKISPKTTDKPFLKIWKNGREVFNYQGAVGYNTTELPYAKSGIYHWFDSTNRWDDNFPTRTLHVHKAILIKDPTNKYNETSIRGMLN